MTRLLVIALAITTTSAASAQDTCSERRLDGAADAAGHPEVTFVEAWRPALAELRACIEASPNACLEVQGQYDDRAFPPAIERSLGSAEAAQIQRAGARAQAVITELVELGVPYGRIHEHPPARLATYRGALVRVMPNCMVDTRASTAPAVIVNELPAWLQTPEAVAAALRVQTTADDLVTPVAPRQGPWSIEGGASFAYQLSGETDAFSFAPRLGVGFSEGGAHVRVFVGAGTSDELEQRAFLEWGASVGGALAPWCTLGATFTHRIGTFRVGEPWYEQSFFLGATSEQRVLDLGVVSFWVHETLSPLGLRLRQGAVEFGDPVNIRDRMDYAARFEAMLVVRGHLDSDPHPAQ